jgi:hypothetical protein
VIREGTLGEIDVADLVQEASRARATGRLHLERPGLHLVLTLEDGRLVFASSSDVDHRLGPKLLRRGAITLRQMEDATRAMRPGRRFGTVLVEMGFLAPKELVRGVVDQTRDIILHAFRWTSGGFRLQDGKAPGEDITLNMSTPQLVLDGISQIDAWTRIDRGCGGLAAQYVAVSGTDALFNQLTLDVDQAALLRAVDKPTDVEALCTGSILNHFEVCRNLWAFRVIGLVRRIESATPLDDDGLEYVLTPDGG